MLGRVKRNQYTANAISSYPISRFLFLFFHLNLTWYQNGIKNLNSISQSTAKTAAASKIQIGSALN